MMSLIKPGLIRIAAIVLFTLTLCACSPIYVWNVVPDIGTIEGEIEVTIYGDGFKKAGIRVFFDDLEAGNVEVVADDIIRATVPAVSREGAVEVRVEDQGGSMGILPAGFTYYLPGQSITFTLPGYILPANNGAGWGADSVDIDDDGDIDLFVANGMISSKLYENLLADSGQFLFAEHDVPHGVWDFLDIKFIEDGFIFVAESRIEMTYKGKNHLFRVLKDEKDGTFRFEDFSATNLPEEIDLSMKAAVGDLDNDGDLDIFTANGYIWPTHIRDHNRYPELNRIYKNVGDTDGDGAPNFEFNSIASEEDLQEISTDVALGDLDNDGFLDVVVGNLNDSRFVIGIQCPDCRNRALRNRRDGGGSDGPFFDDLTDLWFQEMPEILLTTSVELGDVDSDGDLDLLVVNDDESNYLLLNEIDTLDRFVLTEGVLPPDPEDDPHIFLSNYDAKFADFNGDGHLDIIVAGEIMRVYINNGDPDDLHFTETSDTAVPFINYSTLEVQVADFDGDGDKDFVCMDSNEQDRLYLNENNTGIFIDATTSNLPADGEHGYDADFGDLDNDGDLDIVVANSMWFNRLYLNQHADGGEGFIDGSDGIPEEYTFDMDKSSDVEIFDADGDGDLDVFFANQNNQNRLYMNDGSSDYTDETDWRLPSDPDGCYKAEIGDIDDDDDLDVVTAVFGQSKIFLNDGDGFFEDATEGRMPLVPYFTREIKMADIDGDSDLDMVLSNYTLGPEYPGQNLLYLNDGTGHFVDATAGRFPEEVEQVLARVFGPQCVI
ncbi:FG-GAP-like repeat-containing protein, partial [Thermodesulfobacteriota bacterium]